MRTPDRVTAFITQNSNAYLEDLGKGFWVPLEKYWMTPTFSSTSPGAQTLFLFLQLRPTKWQHTNGVPEALLSRVAPETYTLDPALLAREGSAETQLSPFYAYRANLKLFPPWQGVPPHERGASARSLGQTDVIFAKAGTERPLMM